MENVIEELAKLEHDQWQTWSKNLIDQLLSGVSTYETFSITQRLLEKQKRWKELWIPYEKLSEDDKEKDREWAEKVLAIMPMMCPVWQCGGTMKTVERKPPEGKADEYSDGYPGDDQRPDLVCTNCGAVYSFKEFEKK